MSTTPGTPTLSPLAQASRKPKGAPASSRNMSGVAAAGAASRPSYTVMALVSPS